MKNLIIRQIEELLNITLHPAPSVPTPMVGLMVYKEDHPKYLLDDQGQLIGLNLAAAELDDTRWKQVIALLEEHGVELQALNLDGDNLQNLIQPSSQYSLHDINISDIKLDNAQQDATHKKKNITVKEAIRIITKRSDGNGRGMLKELACMLDLPSSTVRSWVLPGGKTGALRRLLEIMVAAREAGYLESLVNAARKIKTKEEK